MKKIRDFKMPKHITLLYLFIPLILCSIRGLSKENDIWFLLNHGKYVLNHGFPVMEPFTIHQNFCFVMQQWLSAVIFYLAYSILGKYGLWICLELVTCLIMYFLYKLCMELTEGRFNLSILITVLTATLLMVQIVPRPQIFTYLLIIIVLYIMERFYNNPNSKLIYLLPLISLIEINLHASMWFMIYIFMLPYIVSLIYDRFKKNKKNAIAKLFIIIVIMIAMGFISPYGVKAITYVFGSYGNYYINQVVTEMHPVQLDRTNRFYRFNLFIVGIIASIICVYIYNDKRTNLKLKNMLLLCGVIFLGLSNIRSYGLLVIGSVPFIAVIIKDSFDRTEEKLKISGIWCATCASLFIITIIGFNVMNRTFTSILEPGVDKVLESNNASDIRMYTSYDNGPYVEYRGIKTYIDARAEVFLKNNNKSKDVFKEYYLLSYGYTSYEKFVNNYNFTHMIISKDERIYDKAIKDERYKIIYKNKKYAVFEKINK